MKPQSVVSVFASCTAGILLTACAATPNSSEPAIQVVNGAAPGETVMCKTDYAVGSHYQTQTECMTSEEKQQMEERTRQAMDDYRVQSSFANKYGGPMGH